MADTNIPVNGTSPATISQSSSPNCFSLRRNTTLAMTIAHETAPSAAERTIRARAAPMGGCLVMCWAIADARVDYVTTQRNKKPRKKLAGRREDTTPL
jgi:hypothetical protein